MKLLYCRDCGDIVKLGGGKTRQCECGAVGGRYMDSIKAEYWGEPMLIGFKNSSFWEAMDMPVEDIPVEMGAVFEAFVFSPDASNVEKVDRP